MQFYKPLLLILLSILIVILFDNASLFSIHTIITSGSLSILNFNLSLHFILISFLLTAFLIVLSAQNVTFSEALFFAFYTASSVGAILSKNIVLAIIFCELMSISSFFIIAAGCKGQESPIRYACTHFFVGMLLISGFSFQDFNLIVAGLLINCACFPFSFWIVDAYPAASLHGTSYLSLFTTKVSFLVMLFHTYHIWQNYNEILAILGAVTAIYGIIFASLEQNIRRFLCYNIVGQMGMLIMAGSLLTQSEDAISILVLNVIFSIAYQILLFSIANSIILQTKIVNFNKVDKFLSVKGICTAIAVLTMSGFPGTSGFISKSLITSNIEVSTNGLIIYKNLFKILHLFLYLSVGLKFLYYTFIDKKQSKILAKNNSNICMLILALMCIVAGNPYLFIYNKPIIFDLIYNKKNIWSQFSLLLLATLLFIPLRKLFFPRISFKMDVDWIFRIFVPCVISLINRLTFIIKGRYLNILQSLTNLFNNLCSLHIFNFKAALSYNSVNFVSVASLVLITILIMLLCLNH